MGNGVMPLRHAVTSVLSHALRKRFKFFLRELTQRPSGQFP
ncbi:hypothetical protein C4J90_3067 [Pseudomonas sp. R2-60-08W]|nr:hypothetical protein C4J90_3067 [Pseudomonas sp. R2-60-08W]